MASEPTSSSDSPGLIAAHAKYAQGAISSVLGYESGETTKSQAVDEMKRASEQNKNQQPAQNNVLGTVEKKAGELAGCEGMVEEGKERIVEK